MCGRFIFITFDGIGVRFRVYVRGDSVTRIDLQAAFSELQALDISKPRYNIAPTQPVLAIVDHGQGRVPEIMRWGFIPSWAKADKLPRNTFNARDDRLLESGMWRGSLRHKRCVIPADGYYEWQKAGSASHPHFVRPADGRTWGLAGLYDIWNSLDGSSIASCAIITTKANEPLSHIHDRMPAILSEEAEEMWLDPSIDHREALVSVVKPLPADAADFYPVSTLVNSAANDSPDNIARSGTLL